MASLSRWYKSWKSQEVGLLNLLKGSWFKSTRVGHMENGDFRGHLPDQLKMHDDALFRGHEVRIIDAMRWKVIRLCDFLQWPEQSIAQ
ncbi:hypothetical protein J6590_000585 [Homalodisca vitripennis]|nr:hypothetical protein J6590_000585 [Homalodisca vitripennis]